MVEGEEMDESITAGKEEELSESLDMGVWVV